MAYGIWLVAPNGAVTNGQFGPGWVETFDAEAHQGRGRVTVTRQPKKALAFKDVGAAMTAWRTQSKVQPLREDGKPNRPMTAFTVEVRQL